MTIKIQIGVEYETPADKTAWDILRDKRDLWYVGSGLGMTLVACYRSRRAARRALKIFQNNQHSSFMDFSKLIPDKQRSYGSGIL